MKRFSQKSVTAIIQARMTSKRLPGKVLMDICGKPCLQHMLERVQKSRYTNNVIVATTDNEIDNLIVDLCRKLSIDTFRGEELDVLGRIYRAAKSSNADVVIRLTADCPMIDPFVIDRVVSAYIDSEYEYVSNTVNRTYPDGLDVEVMAINALKNANDNAIDSYSREHVTPYITGANPSVECGKFSIHQVMFEADFSHIRWTLDTSEDLQRIRKLVAKLPETYSWLNALAVATLNSELLGLQ